MMLTVEAVQRAVVQLPSLKPVVMKLLESFENPDIDTNTLVHEIAQDQALSTRVLRLSNSPFYGLPSHVESLRDAVMVLGFRTVRAAAVAISVTQCFAGKHLDGFEITGFWRHCAAVGLASRTLAKKLRRPTDIAFTAGIVHDMGLLALMSSFPNELSAALHYCREHHCTLCEAERETYGLTHTIVGAHLAKHWQLPESLQVAIRYHEHPEEATANSLADLIHVANTVVQSYGLSEVQGAPAEALSDVAMNRLGLTSADLKEVMEHLDADLETTFHALFSEMHS